MESKVSRSFPFPLQNDTTGCLSRRQRLPRIQGGTGSLDTLLLLFEFLGSRLGHFLIEHVRRRSRWSHERLLLDLGWAGLGCLVVVVSGAWRRLFSGSLSQPRLLTRHDGFQVALNRGRRHGGNKERSWASVELGGSYNAQQEDNSRR